MYTRPSLGYDPLYSVDTLDLGNCLEWRKLLLNEIQIDKRKIVDQWPLSWMTCSVPSRVLRAPLSRPWEAYLQSVSRGPV